VGKADTAYWHRDEQYDLVIISSWAAPSASEENIRWTRQFFDAVRPGLSHGVYVNDLGDEGAERVRDAYGGNYARLLALKKRYDPTNFFHMNQNIDPRG
jgi:FAD/FMN-containing dehydrogenase